MAIEEQNLINLCQQGNLEQFGKLYDLYFEKIYRYLYFRVRHKEIAEDLTSQTFFKALQNIGKFKDGQFSAWLYSIARNAMIDYWRVNKTNENIENCWDLKSNDDLAGDAQMRDKIRRAKEYLKKLEPDQREIIVMRCWDGLAYAEIAEVLGKSEASCKMSFSRAIGRLRQSEAAGLLALLALINFFER